MGRAQGGKLPTWVTTDLAAAENAIGPGRVLSIGEGADKGIITSIVSLEEFQALQKAEETALLRKGRFGAGGQALTEYVLRGPNAAKLFNAGIQRL